MENKDVLQNFIQDPNWEQMEEFIYEHFDDSTSIDSIDTDNDPQTVQSHVIARQLIKDNLDTLRQSFQQLKQNPEDNHVSFK